jgi:hypothetical protein
LPTLRNLLNHGLLTHELLTQQIIYHPPPEIVNFSGIDWYKAFGVVRILEHSVVNGRVVAHPYRFLRFLYLCFVYI